jgi:hypothetical protein
MDTTFSYGSQLGASNGALVGGEPLHQGIVTDQCFVNTPEFLRRTRMSESDEQLYQGKDKPVDRSKFRVFEHEICLTFVDNLGHKPMLMNFETRVGGVSSAFTRRVYESAGLSSTKLAAFPNVFSSLNGVCVSIPKADAAIEKSLFPLKRTYNKFYNEITVSDKYPSAIAKYFPESYEHFLAHFAFKCIGTAKTNDHQPKRADIPVNIAGLVHPPATKPINIGDAVEWYLPFPDELDTLPEIVAQTGNDKDKILVGLRPNMGSLTSIVENIVDILEIDTPVEQLKLKLTLNAFLTARYMGKALRTVKPGEPCYMSLAKGPYCL